MSNDSRNIGEQMNDALYLDPGFVEDEPVLADELEDEIDETVARSEARHKEAQSDAPESLPDEP
jgi:hypothetical protein